MSSLKLKLATGNNDITDICHFYHYFKEIHFAKCDIHLYISLKIHSANILLPPNVFYLQLKRFLLKRIALEYIISFNM